MEDFINDARPMLIVFFAYVFVKVQMFIAVANKTRDLGKEATVSKAQARARRLERRARLEQKDAPAVASHIHMRNTRLRNSVFMDMPTKND